MSLDCGFGVGVGLEIALLKKQLWEKPGKSSALGHRGAASALPHKTQSTAEPTKSSETSWVWRTSPGCFSMGNSRPLVPQSMDGSLCWRNWLINSCLYTQHLSRVDLSWWALAAPAGSSCPSPLGCATGWLPELLNMAMGDVPAPDLRVWMGLEAPHVLPLM